LAFFIPPSSSVQRRDDAPLWRYCRAMSIPDSLRERIELYEGTGRIRPRAGELFTDLRHSGTDLTKFFQ
jgi:tryptophan halogenase